MKQNNRTEQGGGGGGVSGEEALIPTLPFCYLAPSLWTGLVWTGLCCLTGTGRPRTTRLKRARRRRVEEGETWRDRLVQEEDKRRKQEGVESRKRRINLREGTQD